MKISMTKNAIGIVVEDGSMTDTYMIGCNYDSEGDWQEAIFQQFVSNGVANEISGNQKVPESKYEYNIPKRARNADGTLIGDDPSTPDTNEAWVSGKSPVKKKD